MSTISGVPSATNTHQNNIAQFVQDFQAIGTALKTGNLASAQGALNTFEQYVQGNSQVSASQPFGKNGPANSDYQNLVSALQSGNLTGAQQAYSTLQTDLKSVQAVHKGHHHHSAAGSTSSTSAANNPNAGVATNLLVGNNNTNGLDVTA